MKTSISSRSCNRRMVLWLLLAVLGGRGVQADLNEDMIAYYSFDHENIGEDESGWNRNGIVQGVFPAAGVVGQAAEFNGDGAIQVDAFANYDWRSNLTVSLWFVRTGSWGNYAGLISAGLQPNLSWELRLGREMAGGALGGGVATYNDTKLWDFQNINAPPDYWHHAVMLYDGASLRFFLDGAEQPVGRRDGYKIVRTSGPLVMGGWDPHLSQRFVGRLDEVRIYSRVLAKEEVDALYQQGAAGARAEVSAAPPPSRGALAPEPEAELPSRPPLAPDSVEPEAAGLNKPAPWPAPTPATFGNTEACSRCQRWVGLWRAGRKQDVINELNALAK